MKFKYKKLEVFSEKIKGILKRYMNLAIETINKPDYETLLQQDRFWFKSVSWGIIGTAIFGISWISIAKTDEVILVTGKIVPKGDVKKIQMPIGGITKDILVKEGDIVTKGDLLIELDKESSLAEFKTLNESLKLKESQLKLKLREFERFMNSSKVDIELLSDMAELDKVILEKYEFLVKEGASSDLLYLNQKIKVQESLKNFKNAESQLEIRSDRYRQEIDEIKSQINDINGQIAENSVKQRYQSIVAPVSGVVFDIKPKIVGYAAQATETLLKIVPESELEAKIEIPSEDIGFVKKGMNVDISIDSYPATDFGVITGSIKSIGSDALETNQNSQLNVFSYPAKIKLEEQALVLDNGKKLNLKAGMSLNASIKLRKVSYLKLLLSGFKNKTDSLKEL